jgi:hypothetical protein
MQILSATESPSKAIWMAWRSEFVEGTAAAPSLKEKTALHPFGASYDADGVFLATQRPS